MYKLHKLSSPGFTKSFATVEELRLELKEETCGMCLREYGTSLEGMLGSDCGCEYGVSGVELEPGMNGLEELEEELRGV